MRSARLLLLTTVLICACAPDRTSERASVSQASGIAKVTRLAWKAPLQASQPLVRDGRATYAVQGKSIVAIAQDGQVASTQAFDPAISTPVTVVSDTVYYGAGANVAAASFPDGEPAWRVKVAGRVRGAPAVLDDFVIVAAKKLVALDRGTGEERWAYDGKGDFSAEPSIRDGSAFAATSKGAVVRVEVATGQAIWTTETDSNFDGAAASLSDEMVVVAGRDGVVWGLFAETGRERWRFRTRGVVAGNVSVKDDRAWIGTEAGEVICVNVRTGQEVWRVSNLSAVVTTPLWANDLVHVGTDDGKMLALDAADGTVRWTYQLDGEPLGRPLIDDGRVWFTDQDGQVYLVE